MWFLSEEQNVPQKGTRLIIVISLIIGTTICYAHAFPFVVPSYCFLCGSFCYSVKRNSTIMKVQVVPFSGPLLRNKMFRKWEYVVLLLLLLLLCRQSA